MNITHSEDGKDHLSTPQTSSLNPIPSVEDLADLRSQTLYIIVNRGKPYDTCSTRHTSFWIEFSDGRNLLSHVHSESGFFKFEERWNTTQPQESRYFERIIPVVTVSTTTDDMAIRDTLKGTPVNNSESSWSSQSWIGDALKRLQEAKLLQEASTVNAADQMVDVLLEAPDED